MIKSFNAEVKTEFDTYFIDYKPDNQENNRFAVWSFRRTAIYLETLQDAYDQIEFYYDQDLDRAIEQENLLNELEHNQ
jgi:hypothetical protein